MVIKRMSCDQLYEDFQKELLKLNLSDDEFTEKINKVLSKFADEFRYVKVTFQLDAPKNFLVQRGEKWEKTVYDNGKAQKKVWIKNFTTAETGNVFVKIFFEHDCELDKEQEVFAETLADMLFIFGGRFRLNLILNKALSLDVLTGIPNNKTYLDFCGKIIQQGKIAEYNAYCLNIKNCKYINKIVDYQLGDELLAQYAQKLASFAQEDEMIARLGGDNFVALLKKEHHDDFIKYASEIEIEIDRDTEEKTLTLCSCIGFYEITNRINNPGDIMMPISVSMQEAKHHHTNCVRYSREMAGKILYGNQVEFRFPKSLADKEFRMYLQPKVEIFSEKICGAEALARWIYKEGMIQPCGFVPVLEKSGSICKLDFEILRQACELIAKWKKEGKTPIPISVNFSRWHLKNDKIVEDIKAVLDEYQVEPCFIEIELTETMDSEEYEIIESLFRKLKSFGFKTSIDDFGTGYSSLNLLKNFDADIIKLDKSFMDELGKNNSGQKDKILLKNIINMVRELNMKVLAEGVETIEQRDILRRMGCDMIQGYLYEKPLSVVDFEKKIGY